MTTTTNSDNSTITVIPAQPGFFFAEPLGDASGNEVIGISLTPIIAWAVGIHREGKDWWADTTPVGPPGWQGEFAGWMVKLPDGRFFDRQEVVYDDEAAALARFRELDRISPTAR